MAALCVDELLYQKAAEDRKAAAQHVLIYKRSTGWKTKCETEAHNSWLEVTTFTHPFWNVPFNLI